MARGSMGVVYRARDPKQRREIALKLLLSDRHHDDEGHERFKREARSLARLNHPGIVKVYAYGVHRGIPYLTMEFVPGKNLQTLLETNALRLVPAVDVLLKVARAIDHAHSRGVVHRDLKPANVLIGSDNRPRISDFGLAKLEDGRITLTHDGDIVGTPLYMSPEQIQGALAQVGPHSDVWALGVMLYRVLTGTLPFRGATIEEVSREVVHADPPPPRSLVPDVPEDLERVCLTALRKAPSERYQSAGELARDLEAYLQGRPVLAGRVTPAMRARRAYRSVRLHAPTFLPGLITVLTLGLLAGWLAFPATGSDAVASPDQALELAEQAWRDRAYDRLAELLHAAHDVGASTEQEAARLGALEARRAEALPELEAALRALGRPDDALALAAVAADHGDAARLALAADALPEDHPRRAWVAWLADRGPAPTEAARLLGDPTRSADAVDVPPLERARSAVDSGSFRLAAATLAPLLERGDLAARVVKARLLLQRGLPGAAERELAALPRDALPPSVAFEAELLERVLELAPELPAQLAELAKRAPARRQALEAQRWAALAGGAATPGSCPEASPPLRLTWLRAAVAAYAGTLENLLQEAAQGLAGEPRDLKLSELPDPDPLGLPRALHDPLLRAKVVLLRLGFMHRASLYTHPLLLNGVSGRPDVDGVRGPLAAFLQARVGTSAELEFAVGEAKEASPGCDPWPLRLAEAALAAHGARRAEDPARAAEVLDRARRACDLALALNPFHRRARLLSAHIALRRCAQTATEAPARRFGVDVQVAAMLWPQDAAALAWAQIRAEQLHEEPPVPAYDTDALLDLARLLSSGSVDPFDDGPEGAPAADLALDLVYTRLKYTEVGRALESYPERVLQASQDEALNPELRALWQAVAVILDPRRLDEVLLAPAPPAIEGDDKPAAVARIARTLRALVLAAHGEDLPEQWVARARSDLEYARRRWPTLGIEALSALVELAAARREPERWPEVVLAPWPGLTGTALSAGRAPTGPLGDALAALGARDAAR
ncbi:MAG: serine/threonine-protein kinase [Planctomycetota bacterium]